MSHNPHKLAVELFHEYAFIFLFIFLEQNIQIVRTVWKFEILLKLFIINLFFSSGMIFTILGIDIRCRDWGLAFVVGTLGFDICQLGMLIFFLDTCTILTPKFPLWEYS